MSRLLIIESIFTIDFIKINLYLFIEYLLLLKVDSDDVSLSTCVFGLHFAPRDTPNDSMEALRIKSEASHFTSWWMLALV